MEYITNLFFSLAQLYKKNLQDLQQYQEVIDQEVARTIRAHVRRTHHYDELECMFKAPLQYIQEKMSKWDMYKPQRRRKGYTLYFKTDNELTFLNTWNIPLEYTFARREGAKITMKIIVDSTSPIHLIYHPTLHKAVITFWYKPEPLPPNWMPSCYNHNGRTKKIHLIDFDKHQQYWKDYVYKNKVVIDDRENDDSVVEENDIE